MVINVLEHHDMTPITHVIKHALPNETGLKRNKWIEGYSRSKNTARMREKRKDPEYRKRKNERRKRQRFEERAREKKDRLLRITRSMLSEAPAEVSNRTGTALRNCWVTKEVKTVQVTTYAYEPIREADKENSTYVVVYRTE